MENSSAEAPSTKVQAPDTDSMAVKEIEELFKKTLQAIGRHTILAYEIENDQLQLDTIKLNNNANNPVIANRYTKQKEALNKKSEALLQEEATSVKGITEIADKYKELFSSGLNQVREEIESAMIKYGDVLSKDTLGQINKESTRLTAISNQQEQKLETLSSVMKSKTQQLDSKLDDVKVAIDTHSQDSTKLFAANNKCIQANTTLDGKLTTIQQKLDEMTVHFEQKISNATAQTKAQTTAMETINTVVSAKIKEDKESFLKRLAELEDERQADKKLLESFKSEFKAIKLQVESLSSRNDMTLVASPTSSSSSPSPTTQSSLLLSSSGGMDKELVNMKVAITNLQVKCKELVLLMNSLVKAEMSPTTTAETLENLKANSTLERLKGVEDNMIYLLSKVEVMEPRYKLDLAELKQLMESKGIPAGNRKSPSLGEKRSIGTITCGDDEEDKISQLAEEVRRMEHKLATLLEYIHQFRSNVLNPSFPEKLDAGLQHMEDILRNHEMFITFLVDPVAASNTENTEYPSQFALTVTELAKQHSTHPTISPALLTAITKLVANKTKAEYELQQSKKQKTTDSVLPEHMKNYMAQLMAEQMEPLQKKIKDLEQHIKP